MSLHISLIPPNTLCGSDGDFIDAKYIVRNKWKARAPVFLFGCVANPMNCDVCDRLMTVASPRGEATGGMLRCDHAGPCKGHPEGEACQYYYVAFGNGPLCGLRYVAGKIPTREQIQAALR